MDGNADGGGRNGKPDDESGECLLPVKSDPPCYEYRYIQSANCWYLTNVFYLTVTITYSMIKVESSNSVEGRLFFSFAKRKKQQNNKQTRNGRPSATASLFSFWLFTSMFSKECFMHRMFFHDIFCGVVG